MRFSAVLVAAGSGSRAGAGQAKQWRRLAGKSLLRWSAEALLRAGADPLVLVVPPGSDSVVQTHMAGLSGWIAVTGAASRAGSVMAGLKAIMAEPTRPILVHDAARPFVQARHVRAVLSALAEADAALLALPLADTLKRQEPTSVQTLSREGLWRAQTPQAARLGDLGNAYAHWTGSDEPTDDAQVIERYGGRVALVPGDPILMKLTYPEDFAMAERLAPTHRQIRVGQGVDAHRWGPGEAVWLCGLRLPHDQTLIGHSDADAGLHALTDALLGAIGAGDIGDHFPPSDPQWKGASSDRFLRHAVQLVEATGGQIINVDLTLICERPKIKPHRDAMRQRLAELLGLDIGRISVKATTMEGMGFTGRGEGLLAQAIVSLELPVPSLPDADDG